jgi:hypothetical protein
MIFKRQTLQLKYTHEAYHYKASFLLVLTYAIISHKARGTTIKSKKNHSHLKLICFRAYIC